MKQKFISFIALLILLSSFCTYVSAKENMSLSAAAYVLYCADNEKILLGANEHVPMGMASTTKIMTTLITLENAAADNRVVEFTEDMVSEGSSMYLKVGDKVRLFDLAAGMMTVSGNDAANAAAIAIGGSLENFADIMNKRAKEIGMDNTHFVTPSGLSSEDHYSTAYDMALLMSYAMKNEDFAKLTAKKSVVVSFVYPPSMSVTYYNHNRLLSSYEHCTGGKTGYTIATGRCLVTCSEYEGMRLVAVTLNDRQDWEDHKKLYNYGFENYMAVAPRYSDTSFKVEVFGSESEFVAVREITDSTCIVKRKDKDSIRCTEYLVPFVYAPVSKGQTVGKTVYTLGDEVILENKLVAEMGADREDYSFLLCFLKRLFGT